MSTNKKLTIGLLGFGVVGQGLHEVLGKTPGLNATIKRIVVKHKNKTRTLPPETFDYDKEVILNDPEINVVVELIDDAEAAFEFVKEALQKGKAVVSANKKMISEHFEELLQLEKETGSPFLYEAAVCASIPIIRNLEEYYDNDLLRSIEGIVNGSTNYILSKIFSENLSFEAALKQAQDLGYAESNPLLDTGGFDARYKLCILIAHAFGQVLKPENIFRQGIDRLGELELNYSREKNLKIKLKARAYKNEYGRLIAFVLPEFVSESDPFYKIDEVYNAVQIEGCFADRQFFSGKGAGAYPTASAVLSDISALRYTYRYEYKKQGGKGELESGKNIFLKVFIRHDRKEANEIKAKFLHVEESYKNRMEAYTSGWITLESLEDIFRSNESNCSVVLISVPQSEELKELFREESTIEWRH